MKFIILLFIIAISNTSLGQDTLREANSFMYSRYYVLKDDGQFEFRFNHCTGTTKSFGTYKMNNRKISFVYSSIPDSLKSDSTTFSMITFEENGIKNMKRINKSDFSFTMTVIDENQEEPWKKGKARKLEYIYRLD
jgi:hypothetical protein